MEKDRLLPQEAVFAYSIENRINPIFHQHVRTRHLIVNHTPQTQVCMASNVNRMVTVIGLCVDAHGEIERFQIPGWIAEQKASTPEMLFYACGRFAGKYVILVEEEDGTYLWGDATCTLQVNYAFLKENVCVSFSDKITAKAFELGESEIAKDIRKKGANNHPLPYELTMYNGVRALLPNHYLDLNARKSVRINLKIPTGQAPTSVDDVVDSTLKLILNTAREYGKYYSFACAVTSGNDSRVVYAVLSKLGLDQERFTFRHKGFTDATGDIAVPHQFICADGKNHLIIDDMVAPEGFGERVREFLGNWQSPFFINLAYTYLQSFPNLAMTNGNIIGQTGQSYVTHAVPNGLVTPLFMRCKLHTGSHYAYRLLKDYTREIKTSGEASNRSNLFEWEIMIGRGCPMIGTVCDLYGITTLNIFNNYEILRLFVTVSRKARANKELHKHFLKRISPKLLEYPINPDYRMHWTKNCWIFFYLGTYARYFYSELRRRIR